jgi:hypothetical protein
MHINKNNKTMTKSKYDTLVIELQSEGKSVGSISIKKIDLDTLMNVHGQSRAHVLDDIVNTIEEAQVTEKK